MAYKKCLIATTKNLFDISSDYIVSNGILIDGNTLVSSSIHDDATTHIKYSRTYGAGKYVISFGGFLGGCNAFRILSSIRPNVNWTYNTYYAMYYYDFPSGVSTVSFETAENFTIGFVLRGSGSGGIMNIQIEKGSTATSYVPYGYLPSYKKIIKVSNVCQVLNKSKFPATQTINGITFTNNEDGTITANGMASADAQLDLVSHLGETISFSGLDVYSKLIYSGCPDGGSNSTYGIQNTWVRNDFTDNGNGGITNTTDKKYDGYYRFGYAIVIRQGYTANNLVFKPMCINLTEMYGAGHEPSTVVEFRQKFPNDYYDYSPSCWITSYQKNLITDGSSKNLFDIPLTQGYPSDKNYGASTKRTFTIGTYITGFARNNYYDPDNITNVNVSKGIISFKVADASGYGIGIPILLTAGQTYTASCLVDNNVRPGIGISYYKEDGTPISYTQGEMVTNNPIVSFTIPEGTYFTVVVLYGQSNNNYVFSNIQLEKGNAATSYVPYQYL